MKHSRNNLEQNEYIRTLILLHCFWHSDITAITILVEVLSFLVVEEDRDDPRFKADDQVNRVIISSFQTEITKNQINICQGLNNFVHAIKGGGYKA